MDFFEKFAREHGLRLLQPLGGKPETIWLAQTAEGEPRVLRRYAGRDTLCRKLVGVQTPQLAQVYACHERTKTPSARRNISTGRCSRIFCAGRCWTSGRRPPRRASFALRCRRCTASATSTGT